MLRTAAVTSVVARRMFMSSHLEVGIGGAPHDGERSTHAMRAALSGRSDAHFSIAAPAALGGMRGPRVLCSDSSSDRFARAGRPEDRSWAALGQRKLTDSAGRATVTEEQVADYAVGSPTRL